MAEEEDRVIDERGDGDEDTAEDDKVRLLFTLCAVIRLNSES